MYKLANYIKHLFPHILPVVYFYYHYTEKLEFHANVILLVCSPQKLR